MDKDSEESISDTRTRKIKLDRSAETKCIPLVCSWCNRIYKIAHWEVNKGRKTGVSHGICPDCLAQKIREENGGSQPPKE